MEGYLKKNITEKSKDFGELLFRLLLLLDELTMNEENTELRREARNAVIYEIRNLMYVYVHSDCLPSLLSREKSGTATDTPFSYLLSFLPSFFIFPPPFPSLTHSPPSYILNSPYIFLHAKISNILQNVSSFSTSPSASFGPPQVEIFPKGVSSFSSRSCSSPDGSSSSLSSCDVECTKSSSLSSNESPASPSAHNFSSLSLQHCLLLNLQSQNINSPVSSAFSSFPSSFSSSSCSSAFSSSSSSSSLISCHSSSSSSAVCSAGPPALSAIHMSNVILSNLKSKSIGCAFTSFPPPINNCTLWKPLLPTGVCSPRSAASSSFSCTSSSENDTQMPAKHHNLVSEYVQTNVGMKHKHNTSALHTEAKEQELRKEKGIDTGTCLGKQTINITAGQIMEERKKTFDTNKNEASAFSTACDLLKKRKARGDAVAAMALQEIEESKQARHHAAPPSSFPSPQRKRAQRKIDANAMLKHAIKNDKSDSTVNKDAAALENDVYTELIGGEVREDIVSWVLSMKLSSAQKTKESDIAGLHSVKKLIRDKIINPILRPDLHVGLHKAPKGILLFGPPGTGKTTLAKWLSSESGAHFFEVTPSAIISKFHGETETLIKTLFKVAEVDSPSVIFIDEIDSLLGKRRDKEEDSTIRMKNQLLQMMDGVSSDSSKMVVVIGATNRPDMLDDAAIRRLSKRVLVPLPDADARVEQIRMLLKGNASGGCQLTQEELKLVAEKLEGWNGSDIKALCTKAAEYSYDETVARFGGIQNIPDRSAFRPIRSNDFLNALNDVHSSSSGASVLDFDMWAKQFGAL